MSTEPTFSKPPVEPIAYSPADAAHAAGISRSMIYELIKNGRLRPRKLGMRTLILAEDLKTLVDSLPWAAASSSPPRGRKA